MNLAIYLTLFSVIFLGMILTSVFKLKKTENILVWIMMFVGIPMLIVSTYLAWQAV